VPGGRGPLLAVAVIQILVGIGLANSIDERDPKEVVDEVKIAIGIVGGNALVFFGLWTWAKSEPFSAACAGLAVFLAAQVTVIIQHPGSGLVLGIPNLILLAFLIRSVVAAKAVSDFEKWERGPRGPS
jgi:hypothetical protein